MVIAVHLRVRQPPRRGKLALLAGPFPGSHRHFFALCGQRTYNVGMMMTTERRQRRSDDPIEAMHLQLDACRRDARVEAMVIFDEQGISLAASGSVATCDEVAATLPLVGRGLDYFEGEVCSPAGAWDLAMRRFCVDGGSLFVCAVGGATRDRSRQLLRTMGCATRLLESERASLPA